MKNKGVIKLESKKEVVDFVGCKRELDLIDAVQRYEKDYGLIKLVKALKESGFDVMKCRQDFVSGYFNKNGELVK